MPPRKHCVSVVDATATAKAFASASASGTSHLILTLQQQPEEEEEEEEGEGLVLIVVDLVLNRGNEIGLGGAGGAMKGGFAGGSYSGKRRWKGLVIGVLGLVFPSMLVPLLFLLGLHNGFHPPGYVPEQRNSPSDMLKNISHKVISHKAENETKNISAVHNNEQASVVHNNEQASVVHSNEQSKVTAGVSAPPHDGPHSLPIENNSKAGDSAQIIDYAKGGVDQSGKSCELKFGSYCLWRERQREDMKDAMVKRLKVQLFVARAYFPNVVKLPSRDKLSRELRQNIQEVERVLGESTTDVDLPPQYARLGTNTISYI